MAYEPRGEKARCGFALVVAGVLVHFPSLCPCWASPEQMGGGAICPRLTFPVFSVSLCLFFLRVAHKANPPPPSQVRWAQAARNCQNFILWGQGPLPLAFLCSGCTLPTLRPRYTPHGRAEFSTEWKPLPHPSPSTRPSAPAGSQLGENNIFPNIICM